MSTQKRRDKPMNKIIFLVLSAFLLAICSTVQAQAQIKVHRIGFLLNTGTLPQCLSPTLVIR
jgi:hypothetical protein